MNYQVKSAITRGGDILTPDVITIDDKYVRWSKNRGIRFLYLSSINITIPRSKITGVEILNKVIGSDLVITSLGESTIHARMFSPDDAKQIRDILI